MEQGNIEQSPSVGNTQANQHQQTTSPLPANTTSSKKPLIIAGVLLALVMFSIGGYYLRQNRAEFPNQSNQPETTPNLIPTNYQADLSPTPQSVVSPIIDTSPISNGLYLGTFQGKEAFFLTNSRLNVYYENGVKKTGNEEGVLVVIDGTAQQSFSYHEFSNPKRIASFEASADILGVYSFKLNNSKSKLYMIIDLFSEGSSFPNVREEAYQVDLIDYTKKQIWSHNIGDDKYPKVGPVGIDVIESDKYLVLWLGICYGCEASDPHGSVVLNIETGAEEYLGEVGDFQFDLPNKTISYKKLASFEEICEPAPGCDNGKRMVYKPSGEVATSQLP